MDATASLSQSAWSFSTDDAPPAERREAWLDVLRRLRLPPAKPAEGAPLRATVAFLTSPLGVEFAVVDCTAQVIAGRNADQRSAVWLALALEGEVSFWDGSTTTALAPGDVVYGATGIEAALDVHGPARLLFVNAPRVALNHRLVAPLALKLGVFDSARGLGHVLSRLLIATAEALPDLTADQLRPVDLSLTEFLIANLAAEGSPAAKGGAEAARANHFHRVCQTIETLLSNPDLDLEAAAAADGVSPRTLQKLFASAGQTFSTYLRRRRLERCRLDLSSPVSASLSISEICFRWGFNGSAHFSRAFKDQYGVSPRDYRRSRVGSLEV